DHARTVPAPAALAHQLPGPVAPILGVLPRRELAVLRCHGLDERLLARVLGEFVPVDVLESASGRACAIARTLPTGCVVAGRTALWVHTGGRPPSHLEVRRASELDDIVIARVGDLPCLTLVRAVVDLARTAPPDVAVYAVLRARRAGLRRHELEIALNRCRGGGKWGLIRARKLIADLYAPTRQAS
ncbi:hypothetical protein, partial [Actinomyces sp. MRS3W]|uniref:hypothetical protein n=1 Tax=Actinomyces sp. MRS3W TaxID=2800796 RepID=UPI0028FD97B7